MAKAAQEALALTLAKEEAANGVRVNIVVPGLTNTDLGARVAKGMGDDDIHELTPDSPSAASSNRRTSGHGAVPGVRRRGRW